MSFDEAKAIHQMLAKMLHPDGAAPEEQARRTRLMQRVNAAYDKGDVVTLRAIATEVLGGSSTPPPKDAADHARRQAEQAEQKRQQEAARRAQEQAERQRQAEAQSQARRRAERAEQQRQQEAARRAREEAEWQRQAEAKAKRLREAEAARAGQQQAEPDPVCQSPSESGDAFVLRFPNQELRDYMDKRKRERFKVELDYARADPTLNTPGFLQYLEQQLPEMRRREIWGMFSAPERVNILYNIYQLVIAEQS